MDRINIVKLLQECVVISWKQCWLTWIGWHLDRYIMVSKKNKCRYYKIQRMAHRFNCIFAENLFCDTAEEEA